METPKAKQPSTAPTLSCALHSSYHATIPFADDLDKALALERLDDFAELCCVDPDATLSFQLFECVRPLDPPIPNRVENIEHFLTHVSPKFSLLLANTAVQ